MIDDVMIMLVIDTLLFIFWVAVFLHCSKYIARSFKRRETESEKLVRESKEFMLGLRD